MATGLFLRRTFAAWCGPVLDDNHAIRSRIWDHADREVVEISHRRCAKCRIPTIISRDGQVVSESTASTSAARTHDVLPPGTPAQTRIIVATWRVSSAAERLCNSPTTTAERARSRSSRMDSRYKRARNRARTRRCQRPCNPRLV